MWLPEIGHVSFSGGTSASFGKLTDLAFLAFGSGNVVEQRGSGHRVEVRIVLHVRMTVSHHVSDGLVSASNRARMSPWAALSPVVREYEVLARAR